MWRISGRVVLACALVVSACGGSSDPPETAEPDPTASDEVQPAATETPDPTAVPEPTEAPEPTCTIAVDGFPAPTASPLPQVAVPQALASADAGVWADALPDDDEVAVLDGLLYTHLDDALVRVDPGSGTTEVLALATGDASGEIVSVSAVDGELWLVLQDAGDGRLGEATELVRIDTTDGCGQERVVVPTAVRQVQAVTDTLWVNEYDRVYEIDPVDGSILHDYRDDEAFGIGNFEAMGSVGDVIVGVGYCGGAAAVDTTDGSSFETRFGDRDRCGDVWAVGPTRVLASDRSGDPEDPAVGWAFDPVSGAIVGGFTLPFDVLFLTTDEGGGLAVGEAGEIWRLPVPSTTVGSGPAGCLDFDRTPSALPPFVRGGEFAAVAVIDSGAFASGLPGQFQATAYLDLLVAVDGSGLSIIDDEGGVTAIEVPWFTPDAVSSAGGLLWVAGLDGDLRRLVGVAPDGCPVQVVSTPEPAITVAATGPTMWVQGPFGGIELDPTTGAVRRDFAQAFAEANAAEPVVLPDSLTQGHVIFGIDGEPILIAVGPCGELAALQTEVGEAALRSLDRCDLDGAVLGDWGAFLWSIDDSQGAFVTFDDVLEPSGEGAIGAAIASVVPAEGGAWVIAVDGGLWFAAG